MKKYITPEVMTISMSISDVITTSGGNTLSLGDSDQEMSMSFGGFIS